MAPWRIHPGKPIYRIVPGSQVPSDNLSRPSNIDPPEARQSWVVQVEGEEEVAFIMLLQLTCFLLMQLIIKCLYFYSLFFPAFHNLIGFVHGKDPFVANFSFAE